MSLAIERQFLSKNGTWIFVLVLVAIFGVDRWFKMVTLDNVALNRQNDIVMQDNAQWKEANNQYKEKLVSAHQSLNESMANEIKLAKSVNQVIDINEKLHSELQHRTDVLRNEVARLESLKEELTATLEEMNSKFVDVGFILGQHEERPVLISESIDQVKIQANVIAMLMQFAPLSPVTLSKYPLSSGYGKRNISYDKASKFHTGVDFAMPIGTPVFAPADGYVKFVRKSDKGNGNFLLLQHSWGFTTSYSHLDSFNVKEGDWVSKNSIIAFSGNTGYSTGPHLHYEIKQRGRRLNPEPFVQFSNTKDLNTLYGIKGVDWGSLTDSLSVFSIQSAIIFR